MSAASGLGLEQAPGLSVPASFFLAIPIGILVAGFILITTGAMAFASPFTPQALALTHAGTLGVLTMGMLGALYQMIPVIAGTAVPFTRLAHIVQALLLAGLAGFLWQLLGGPVVAMLIASGCFTAALVIFLLPLGWALLRPPTRNQTVQGMRLAIVSLAVITFTGLILAKIYSGGEFTGARLLWLQIHLSTALLGWVGGLIMAVSWQVIPMFYLAPAVSKTTLRWLFGLLLSGLLLPLVILIAIWPFNSFMSAPVAAAIGALPAALVVWLLHPVLILRNLLRRIRKRNDASLLFWRTGLFSALLLIPLGTAAVLLEDPRWQILFGWVSIWGWAGLILHGMLSRIVPFLVWFHRYSAQVGLQSVPSMRSLLSQQRIKTGFALHFSSVIVGLGAISLQTDFLAQLTGGLLAGTAVSLGSMLIHTLKPRNH